MTARGALLLVACCSLVRGQEAAIEYRPCNPTGTNPSAMEQNPYGSGTVVTAADIWNKPMDGSLGCECWPEFKDSTLGNGPTNDLKNDICSLECNGKGVSLYSSYFGDITAKTRRPRGCGCASQDTTSVCTATAKKGEDADIFDTTPGGVDPDGCMGQFCNTWVPREGACVRLKASAKASVEEADPLNEGTTRTKADWGCGQAFCVNDTFVVTAAGGSAVGQTRSFNIWLGHDSGRPNIYKGKKYGSLLGPYEPRYLAYPGGVSPASLEPAGRDGDVNCNDPLQCGCCSNDPQPKNCCSQKISAVQAQMVVAGQSKWPSIAKSELGFGPFDDADHSALYCDDWNSRYCWFLPLSFLCLPSTNCDDWNSSWVWSRPPPLPCPTWEYCGTLLPCKHPSETPVTVGRFVTVCVDGLCVGEHENVEDSDYGHRFMWFWGLVDRTYYLGERRKRFTDFDELNGDRICTDTQWVSKCEEILAAFPLSSAVLPGKSVGRCECTKCKRNTASPNHCCIDNAGASQDTMTTATHVGARQHPIDYTNAYTTGSTASFWVSEHSKVVDDAYRATAAQVQVLSGTAGVDPSDHTWYTKGYARVKSATEAFDVPQCSGDMAFSTLTEDPLDIACHCGGGGG